MLCLWEKIRTIINNLTLLDDNDARKSTSYWNSLFLSDKSKD